MPDDRCQQIQCILSDVDGVLTDGGILFNNEGIETKSFHIRDGLGIKLWQRAGYQFGILTARTSHIVKVRSAELGIKIVRQGFEEKLPIAQQIMAELKVDPAQVCYIGDDLTDLPVMRHVGWSVAVADAVSEIRDHADQVTKAAGGCGAVRELIEYLLRTKGRWEDLIRHYTTD
jgi:YrbI family 3-deoxy-D-manno-octulosonate 8-phosphate phosphatase